MTQKKPPRAANNPYRYPKEGMIAQEAVYKRLIDDPTDKKARFIMTFVSNGHRVSDAAREAGYSDKCAHVYGAMMMKDPEVIDVIRAIDEENCVIAGLTAQRTIREVARIAYFDPAKLFDDKGRLIPVNEMSPDVRACIMSFDVEERFETIGDESTEQVVRARIVTNKIKLHDKVRALDIAMKHQGLYEKDNEQVRSQMFAVMVPHKSDGIRAFHPDPEASRPTEAPSDVLDSNTFYRTNGGGDHE